MKFAAAILAFCALTGTAQAQDCKLTLIDTIDFKVEKEKLLIPVELGDVQKDFELSFGNAFNAINFGAATDLGLKLSRMSKNYTVSRRKTKVTQTAQVPLFQVGRLAFKDAELLVLPPEVSVDGSSGHVGTQIFRKVDIELDIAAKRLRLISQDHCPGAGVYWTSTPFAELPLDWGDLGYIRTSMQLDGHPVRVALEPNERSTVGMNLMRQIFGVDENSPGMTAAGEDDGVKLFHYSFKTLEAGGLTVANPSIIVRNQPPGPLCTQKPRFDHKEEWEPVNVNLCIGGADIVLGYSVLSKLHMYFALKDKHLYLTAADAH